MAAAVLLLALAAAAPGGDAPFPRLLMDGAGLQQLRRRVQRPPYSTSFAIHLNSSVDLGSDYRLPNTALLAAGTGEARYAQSFRAQLLPDVRDWARLLALNGSAGLDFRATSRGLQVRLVSFDLVAASGVFRASELQQVQQVYSRACGRLMESGADSFNRYDIYTDSFRFSNTDADRLSACLLYTSPSPRDATLSRMPSSA